MRALAFVTGHGAHAFATDHGAHASGPDHGRDGVRVAAQP